MLDKIKFMEMLQDLKEIAATQGNLLSEQEIREYFSEMELLDEHYRHIYTYLAENRIEVEGQPVKQERKTEKEDEFKEEDSIFLKMYLKELRTLEKLTAEEEFILLREAKDQIPGARDRLIHNWLPKVVRLAKQYKNHGVCLEDLIQEGNIGLLSGVEGLAVLEDSVDLKKYLKQSIVQAMEEIIDAVIGEDNLENTIIGKSNLLEEASVHLAEDLGRVATLEELAEYTKLDLDEINDIRTLSLEALKIGKGESNTL